MKLISMGLLPGVLLICMLASACSGVRPLHKGETIRCPSCGAEFPVEQGLKGGDKTK